MKTYKYKLAIILAVAVALKATYRNKDVKPLPSDGKYKSIKNLDKKR